MELFLKSTAFQGVRTLKIEISVGNPIFSLMFAKMSENHAIIPWFSTVETLKVYEVLNFKETKSY